jgi:transcriptional regulator with XRE-family HTH domain
VEIAMKARQAGMTQQQAAAKAGLRDRKTVARYERLGRLPSELKEPRTYRTRVDAFAEDWPEVEALLDVAPGLESKTIFEWLQRKRPGRYSNGQLRTLQRRVRRWRGLNQAQDLVLEQEHEPGEALQTDGTWMNRLEITVGGEPFEHLVIHHVLPYSNWEWATVAQSESLLAIEAGLESALRELGAVPGYHQTDHSTAATHRLGAAERAETGQSRGYNGRYLALMERYGMQARTTQVSSPHENGDVESSNGGLKRAVEQALLVRGSRDFESREAYEALLEQVVGGRNAGRGERLAEELAVMRPLVLARKPVMRQMRVRVSRAGTIRVMKKAYSVPSSLVGRQVEVRLGEWELEVRYAGQVVRRTDRVVGKSPYDVDYRHVIDSLLRKPGGFRRYRYRDALFPRAVFTEAWEDLCRRKPPRQADLHYLRIVKLAATTLEVDVATELRRLLDTGDGDWDAETLLGRLAPPATEPPKLELLPADLAAYDGLLDEILPGVPVEAEVSDVAAD